MDPIQERQLNQAAYRQLSSFIQKSYPPGRFLAISGGNIIADAASFEELNSLLHRMGNPSPEVLVGQAGMDYPETVTIFAVVGFASDAVVTATKASSPDFKGLAGLPFLRLLEYGGDADWFWLRLGQSQP